MSARKDIFARLKTTLDRVHNPTVRYSRADRYIQKGGSHLIPERGRADGAARTALFVSEAEYAAADVRRLARLDDVPDVVKGILNEAKIGAVKIAPDDRLQAMDWSGIEVAFGRGVGSDHAGLSFAYGGVSETGTLVMTSSAQSPTTLNFLPDVHIVVVREETIAANYEEVWNLLRQDAKPDTPRLPRTVNWITGPSRTADIEQTLLLGAHGPRKLIILLIDAEIS
ncbi:LutC/YkgG family protein [Magnetovibrio sp.]|uniref:LutC/YkgG family protein n=1 Tax=Magnetovibrio sp. TaxID=2024836 RepID=UPI002F952BC7